MKIALVVTVPIVAYVSLYYATLSLPEDIRIRPRQFISLDGLQFYEGSPYIFVDGQRLPDFHGVPSVLLAPMYHLDAHWIRVGYWQPYPRNTELDFRWLLQASTTETK